MTRRELAPDERKTEEIIVDINHEEHLRIQRELMKSQLPKKPEERHLDMLGISIAGGVAAGAIVTAVGAGVLFAMADRMPVQQFGLVLQATFTGAVVLGASIAARVKRRQEN